MTPAAEHRRYRRFGLSLPVEVKSAAVAHLHAATRDISAGGLYLTMPEDVEPGSELEWEVMLPAELCGGEPVHIRCRGKVLRVEHDDMRGKIGVAATIEDYQFIKIQ